MRGTGGGLSRFQVSEARNDKVRIIWGKDETCYQLPFGALRALAGHEEISRQEFNDKVYPMLSILPCRVFPSPLMCMLTYNKEKPWVSRTTTVLQTVWDLYQVVSWFWVMEENYRVRGNKKRANQLRDVLERFMNVTRKQWEESLKADLEAFHRRMVANDVTSVSHADARACMIDFAQNCMWPYTIRLINDLERCVYDAANLEQPMMRPVQECLTSADPVPRDAPWPDQQASKDALQMQAWFQAKQSNVIAQELIDDDYQLRKDKVVPKCQIDHSVIVDLLKKWRNDPAQVWERCIPYHTLWQYCMFFDRHLHILGDASKGFLPKHGSGKTSV